jgi:hypothetical protein
MTVATINVLLGIISIVFAVAVALGVLAYVVEGVRGRGMLRRWNLVIALVLGACLPGVLTSVGQDFARASDSWLLRQPAGPASLLAVFVWMLITTIVLVAGVRHLRSLRRSLAA